MTNEERVTSNKEDLQKSSTATLPATETATVADASTPATITNTIPTDAEREKKISDMYDASLAANKASIESEYQQNLADAQYNKDKIGETYDTARKNASANYEIERRNANMAAADSGLNSGTLSQENQARTESYQDNAAEINKEEAEKTAEADRNITSLKTDYDQAIADATATSDYNKAAALLDEYNQKYNRQLDQASTMSNYGDFSGYATLYGQTVADNMKQVWNLQNPDLAYTMGNIDATQYFNITGKQPNG